MLPPLSIVTCISGLVLLLLGAAALRYPHQVREGIAAFPRNTWAARVLAGIDLAWVGLLLHGVHLGRFEHLKPALFLLVPAAFFLIIHYLDELLAPRALGGLFLLVAHPILFATRVFRWGGGSDLALVMVVFAYVLVVAGIILVLSPYRFRQWAARGIASLERCRAAGMAGAGCGAAMLAMAIIVF
jgi:hypothetical protein